LGIIPEEENVIWSPTGWSFIKQQMIKLFLKGWEAIPICSKSEEHGGLVNRRKDAPPTTSPLHQGFKPIIHLKSRTKMKLEKIL